MLMCENSHDVRDFDGSGITVPCGDTATFAVGLTYEDVNLVPPQEVSVVLYVCESCKNLITAPSARSSADHPDHVEVVYVHELGQSDIKDKLHNEDTVDLSDIVGIMAKADIADMTPKGEKPPIGDQTGCWCESSACEKAHQMARCPASVDVYSPFMVFVGRVCERCATRIEDNDGRQYIIR